MGSCSTDARTTTLMYCSIDIETTGLNVDKHQVLEFGAVLWLNDDVLQCPTFESVVKPEGDIVGHPYALQMNASLLRRIADGEGVPLSNVCLDFQSWLFQYGAEHGSVIAIGKNFGSFDLQFLRRCPMWPKALFSYRSLDVGSMYATREGIPSLKTLLSGYDIPGEEHTALHDARVALAAVIEVMQ